MPLWFPILTTTTGRMIMKTRPYTASTWTNTENNSISPSIMSSKEEQLKIKHTCAAVIFFLLFLMRHIWWKQTYEVHLKHSTLYFVHPCVLRQCSIPWGNLGCFLAKGNLGCFLSRGNWGCFLSRGNWGCFPSVGNLRACYLVLAHYSKPLGLLSFQGKFGLLSFQGKSEGLLLSVSWLQ